MPLVIFAPANIHEMFACGIGTLAEKLLMYIVI